MPQLAWVERQIRRIEGFDVRFTHPDGRDVRGDMSDLRSYEYARRLSDDRTVSEWVALRFRAQYRGFDVEVRHADGTAAHGNTLLGNLRREYL